MVKQEIIFYVGKNTSIFINACGILRELFDEVSLFGNVNIILI